MAREAKIFATWEYLLRDDDLNGVFCALVLPEGCYQSSPPKSRNCCCISRRGFCSVRKFPTNQSENSQNCFCALNPEPLIQDCEGLTGLVSNKYCVLKVDGSMCKRVWNADGEKRIKGAWRWDQCQLKNKVKMEFQSYFSFLLLHFTEGSLLFLGCMPTASQMQTTENMVQKLLFCL